MEFIKQKYRHKILQHFQEEKFINQGYRQKLQDSKESRVFHYRTYPQKYEPTEDDPKKEWKKIRLYGED